MLSHANFYRGLRAALLTFSDVTGLVSSANIRPSVDRGETKKGPDITYEVGLTPDAGDRTNSRGDAELNIFCRSPDNKVEAGKIAEAVDKNLSAKSLNDAGFFRCAKLVRTDRPLDSEIEEDQKYAVVLTYTLKVTD